jgi:hypothetical protein
MAGLGFTESSSFAPAMKTTPVQAIASSQPPKPGYWCM